MIRLCTHNNRICGCSDAAAQPCIGGLIEKYLDALKMYVQSGGLEGAGDVAGYRRGLATLTTTFATVAELESWMKNRPIFWRYQ
jgi:hypothetical protein